MPPDRSCFTAVNLPQSSIPNWMGSFTLSAPPNTDLWRKPPCQDTVTAPILYTSLRHPFVTAEVTVSADWQLEWDQAGLVIFAGAPPGQARNPTPTTRTGGQTTTSSTQCLPPPYSPPPGASTKWVKVGLEYYNNACHATSVCASSEGADWAVTSLCGGPGPGVMHSDRTDLKVKLERIGYALWLSYHDMNGWRKLREFTGFFYGVEDKSVRIGVWASRPANLPSSPHQTTGGRRTTSAAGAVSPTSGTADRNLCVDFEGLEIF